MKSTVLFELEAVKVGEFLSFLASISKNYFYACLACVDDGLAPAQFFGVIGLA
jgi:hypothetical protein